MKPDFFKIETAARLILAALFVILGIFGIVGIILGNWGHVFTTATSALLSYQLIKGQ
jgi:hypothetical protein